MSRTYKDRPYWVTMNDRTLGTVEHHDHREPAPGYYTERTVKRGTRKLAEYGEHQWILRHTDGTPGMSADDDLKYVLQYPDIRSGKLRWYFEKPQHLEWNGRTVIKTKSSHGCDIRPYKHSDERWNLRCTITPYLHNKPSFHYYDEYHNKAPRKSGERSMRHSVKQSMHGAALAYSTKKLVDDLVLPSRSSPDWDW